MAKNIVEHKNCSLLPTHAFCQSRTPFLAVGNPILFITRIVRESECSPASALCSRARETIMDYNPKQDLVNVEVQIMSFRSQDIGQKQNSDIIQKP